MGIKSILPKVNNNVQITKPKLGRYLRNKLDFLSCPNN